MDTRNQGVWESRASLVTGEGWFSHKGLSSDGSSGMLFIVVCVGWECDKLICSLDSLNIEEIYVKNKINRLTEKIVNKEKKIWEKIISNMEQSEITENKALEKRIINLSSYTLFVSS